MKIITKNNIAIYKFEDHVDLILEDNIKVPSMNSVICDCNSDNSIIYTNVTDTPNDFVGHKYYYDGNNWIVTEEYNDQVKALKDRIDELEEENNTLKS